ncbi:MAG: PHP domain-containing protein, partial [bacterium]
MNKYFPLHVHSHFSLLDGLSKPIHITNRLTELELPGTAVTDHGTLSGSIQMLKACKTSKHQLILGCELYISEHDANIRNENNRKHTHMLVLAKNDAGWRDLVKLTSEANSPDNFYYKPRISIDQLKPYLAEDNLIIFGGHWGSTIADMVMGENGVIDIE